MLVVVAVVIMHMVMVMVAVVIMAVWRVQLARHTVPPLAGREENGECVDVVVHVHASGQAVHAGVIYGSEQGRIIGRLRQHVREPIQR